MKSGLFLFQNHILLDEASPDDGEQLSYIDSLEQARPLLSNTFIDNNLPSYLYFYINRSDKWHEKEPDVTVKVDR